MSAIERKEQAETVGWLLNRAIECALAATSAAGRGDVEAEIFWSQEAVNYERAASQAKGDGNVIN